MKSNNSTFTGIMLLVLLWLTYSILTGPSKEEIEQQKQEAADAIKEQEHLDSLDQVQRQLADNQFQQIQNDTLLTDQQKDSIQTQLQKDLLGSKYGIFTSAAVGTDGQATLENEKLKITFNKKGGSISGNSQATPPLNIAIIKQYKVAFENGWIFILKNNNNQNISIYESIFIAYLFL